MSFDTLVDKKFSELWSIIATSSNVIKSDSSSGMDNWTHEKYSNGDYIAGMMDSGYHRYICRVESGVVLWRVDERCSFPTEFHSIDRTTFLAI